MSMHATPTAHSGIVDSLYSELVRSHGHFLAALGDELDHHPAEMREPEFWSRAGAHSTSLISPELFSGVKPAPRWCIMMSASTRVGVRWGTQQQVNGLERRRMYVRVLRNWLLHMAARGAAGAMPLILVENSDDRPFADELRAQLNSSQSAFFEGVPKALRDAVDVVTLRPATTCIGKEIGCHEASAVLRAIWGSVYFRRGVDGTPPRCTHAVKVTGRYMVPQLPDEIARCASRGATSLIVQNRHSYLTPTPRQETHVVGFDILWAEALFGWSQVGGMCMECHMTAFVRILRALRDNYMVRPTAPAADTKPSTHAHAEEELVDWTSVFANDDMTNATSSGARGLNEHGNQRALRRRLRNHLSKKGAARTDYEPDGRRLSERADGRRGRGQHARPIPADREKMAKFWAAFREASQKHRINQAARQSHREAARPAPKYHAHHPAPSRQERAEGRDDFLRARNTGRAHFSSAAQYQAAAEERRKFVGGFLIDALCELPRIPITPTREGSTGLLRSYV